MPTPTREQFDAAAKKVMQSAPAGLNRDQFFALIDKELSGDDQNKVTAAKTVGADEPGTWWGGALKSLKDSLTSSVTDNEAVKSAAHPQTVGDMSSLLLPNVGNSVISALPEFVGRSKNAIGAAAAETTGARNALTLPVRAVSKFKEALPSAMEASERAATLGPPGLPSYARDVLEKARVDASPWKPKLPDTAVLSAPKPNTALGASDLQSMLEELLQKDTPYVGAPSEGGLTLDQFDRLQENRAAGYKPAPPTPQAPPPGGVRLVKKSGVGAQTGPNGAPLNSELQQALDEVLQSDPTHVGAPADGGLTGSQFDNLESNRSAGPKQTPFYPGARLVKRGGSASSPQDLEAMLTDVLANEPKGAPGAVELPPPQGITEGGNNPMMGRAKKGAGSRVNTSSGRPATPESAWSGPQENLGSGAPPAIPDGAGGLGEATPVIPESPAPQVSESMHGPSLPTASENVLSTQPSGEWHSGAAKGSPAAQSAQSMHASEGANNASFQHVLNGTPLDQTVLAQLLEELGQRGQP